MSYYERAYKRRVNKGGLTRQEKIQFREARTFLAKVHASPYKVTFSYEEYHVEGLLKPKRTHSESNLISELHVPKKIVLDTGQIIQISEQPWLVTFKDSSYPGGISKYTVTHLHETVEWKTPKGTFSAPVFVYNSVGRAVEDFFKKVDTIDIYSEVNIKKTLLMQYDENMTTEVYFTLGKQQWRAFKIDTVAVPGAMFVTLDETLKEVDPVKNIPIEDAWRDILGG